MSLPRRFDTFAEIESVTQRSAVWVGDDEIQVCPIGGPKLVPKCMLLVSMIVSAVIADAGRVTIRPLLLFERELGASNLGSR